MNESVATWSGDVLDEDALDSQQHPGRGDVPAFSLDRLAETPRVPHVPSSLRVERHLALPLEWESTAGTGVHIPTKRGHVLLRGHRCWRLDLEGEVVDAWTRRVVRSTSPHAYVGDQARILTSMSDDATTCGVAVRDLERADTDVLPPGTGGLWQLEQVLPCGTALFVLGHGLRDLHQPDTWTLQRYDTIEPWRRDRTGFLAGIEPTALTMASDVASVRLVPGTRGLLCVDAGGLTVLDLHLRPVASRDFSDVVAAMELTNPRSEARWIVVHREDEELLVTQLDDHLGPCKAVALDFESLPDDLASREFQAVADPSSWTTLDPSKPGLALLRANDDGAERCVLVDEHGHAWRFELEHGAVVDIWQQRAQAFDGQADATGAWLYAHPRGPAVANSDGQHRLLWRSPDPLCAALTRVDSGAWFVTTETDLVELREA